MFYHSDTTNCLTSSTSSRKSRFLEKKNEGTTGWKANSPTPHPLRQSSELLIRSWRHSISTRPDLKNRSYLHVMGWGSKSCNLTPRIHQTETDIIILLSLLEAARHGHVSGDRDRTPCFDPLIPMGRGFSSHCNVTCCAKMLTVRMYLERRGKKKA